MRGRTSNTLLTIVAVAAMVLWGAQYCLPRAAAQTTHGQTLMTWQALNFYPADFAGKAIPTDGSRVLVSVELIRNGAFVDLSKYLIRWYLDSAFVGKGIGQKEMAFTVTNQSGSFHIVRASIEFASGDSADGSVSVPVGDRRIALEGISPFVEVPAQTDISLEAFPYFFNIDSIDELNFFWTVGGQRVKGVLGNTLSLTVPADSAALAVGMVAQGKNDLIEYAEKNVTAGIRQ
jgi:hypothetical protein